MHDERLIYQAFSPSSFLWENVIESLLHLVKWIMISNIFAMSTKAQTLYKKLSRKTHSLWRAVIKVNHAIFKKAKSQQTIDKKAIRANRIRKLKRPRSTSRSDTVFGANSLITISARGTNILLTFRNVGIRVICKSMAALFARFGPREMARFCFAQRWVFGN